MNGVKVIELDGSHHGVVCSECGPVEVITNANDVLPRMHRHLRDHGYTPTPIQEHHA